MNYLDYSIPKYLNPFGSVQPIKIDLTVPKDNTNIASNNREETDRFAYEQKKALEAQDKKEYARYVAERKKKGRGAVSFEVWKEQQESKSAIALGTGIIRDADVLRIKEQTGVDLNRALGKPVSKEAEQILKAIDTEDEAKLKENASRAFNALMRPILPSTYVNDAIRLSNNGNIFDPSPHELSDEQSLALDLAFPFAWSAAGKIGRVAKPYLQLGYELGRGNWQLSKLDKLNRPITLGSDLTTHNLVYTPKSDYVRLYRMPGSLKQQKPKTSFAFFERTPVNNLTSHLLGDDAVKMFKEYGGTKIPEGSINGELLRKYIPEVRERYGITGNTDITDEEIAEALYKHVNELGENTAAINASGEPLLLFRGDTKRYTELKPHAGTGSLASADNELGTLFLGELPGTRDGGGLERYLGIIDAWGLRGPGTGAAKALAYDPSYLLYDTRFGPVYKLSPKSMEFGANDINGFVVKTPKVRDATEEIVVINPFESIPRTKRMGNNIYDHYSSLLKEAENKKEGLLRSNPVFTKSPETGEMIPEFRDEHSDFTYFALPNFNIRNAKHILPYDLRIPRNWSDPNIYKSILTPLTIGGTGVGLSYPLFKLNKQ